MKCKNAVILAGGKSRRMKFDKQELEINGEKLIGRTIQILSTIFDGITVVTNRPELYEKYKVNTISDIYPGFGPISGIHTALHHAKDDLIFVMACDMPYINLEFIKYLDKEYQDEDGVITTKGNHIEPLNAIYSKALLGKIEENIRKGKYRISDLVAVSRFKLIDEEKAKKFDPDLKMFRNLNTPEDLEELLNHLKSN
ncbi:molybdenum cofactor guanylyltransferase [Microaceticoccus formicicus]|uniref:molybdenum cofactor guanylyltransferase n=1 Tax=Microaceticoccus formicicus TaxID=3118105 RepID=UPI003CD04A51|nr:molybdenum cofactor guanylyltransferase [Peptoniphilaceae bacterium AMB_02]